MSQSLLKKPAGPRAESAAPRRAAVSAVPAAPAPEAAMALAFASAGTRAPAPPPSPPPGARVVRRKCARCAAAEETERATGVPQPLCPACEREREAMPVQRRADAASVPGSSSPSPPETGGAVAGSGGGRPLDPGTRAFFAAGFGRGPGGVRAHPGAEAPMSRRDHGHIPPLAPHPAPGGLLVGPADDPLEREADAVAERVVSAVPASAATPALSRSPDSAPVRRQCAACDEEARTPVQRKSEGGGGGGLAAAVVPDAGQVLHPVGGRPLDAATRAFFEARLGRDLAAVRVHEGPRASAAARSVNALAYTVGPSVVFREGQFRPDTGEGKRLLAHELAHVAQQGHAPVRGAGAAEGVSRAPRRALQRKLDPMASLLSQADIEKASYRELEEAIKAAEAFLGFWGFAAQIATSVDENLALLNRERDLRKLHEAKQAFNAAQTAQQAATSGTAVGKLGIVALDGGSYLYRTPDPHRPYARALPLNTRMAVSRLVPGGWYYVVLQDGDSGYVPVSDVNTQLPDPGARLYRIQQGEGAQAIVKKHFRDFKWGEDERFYVNVLVYVNHQAGRKGVSKPSLDADWDTTVTHAGSQVWIPGEAYAKALKGTVSSGSFTYEAWQTVKNVAAAIGEFLLGTAAFIVGLLHGALESLWDVLAGLVDLAEMLWKLVKSIVTGEIVNDISNLWGSLSKLKPGDLLDAAVDWLDKKWNAPGIWDRWHFRGWLIGYIIMEVVMMIFSGGILTGLKWVGKTAKVSKLLTKLPGLAKVAKRAEMLGESAQVLKLRQGITKAGEALAAARKWAGAALKIPADILADLSAEAIERLKKLPAWAKERFASLSPTVMRVVLGCASPCKVDIDKIIAYLAELGAKGIKGVKLLTPESVLKALPGDLNKTKIAAYLDSHPALMEAIKKAELTDTDLGGIAGFLTNADRVAGSGEDAYKTFSRYLTQLVPAKTQGDYKKFNEVAKAVGEMSEQGRAMKGPMFEAWVRTNVPHFTSKKFTRVTFEPTGKLVLAKEQRVADFFIDEAGELWDFKHVTGIADTKQAKDYANILLHTEQNLPTVRSVHYVFPDYDAALKNRYLVEKHRFDVRYLDPATGEMKVFTPPAKVPKTKK